ncbi:hypothetical protein YC2023_002322 [Brassica napus]
MDSGLCFDPFPIGGYKIMNMVFLPALQLRLFHRDGNFHRQDLAIVSEISEENKKQNPFTGEEKCLMPTNLKLGSSLQLPSL